MKDWVDEQPIRNEGIELKTDARNLKELLCIISCILSIAGILFFYSWVRSQILGIGYESQRLQTVEDDLKRKNDGLQVEHRVLKNPARIDQIARDVLGMYPLVPSQVVGSNSPSLDDGRAPVLALAGGSAGGARDQAVGQLTN